MNCTIDNRSDTSLTHALMQEITTLLADFITTDQEGVIDLHGLPMMDADKIKLEELLGIGEVRATIQVSGETEIWETALSGVWWIRHKGANGKTIAEQINVTDVPEILKTHKDDAKAALKRLQSAFHNEGNKEQGDLVS